MCRTLLLSVAASVVPFFPATGQRLSLGYAAAWTPAPPSAAFQAGSGRTASMVSGGILGGLGGLLMGGYLGYLLEVSGGCSRDLCGLGGAVLGGLAGEVVLLPLGVHLGNESQGRFPEVLASSVGVGVAGLAVASLLNRSEVLVVVPIGQLWAAIAMEQRTAQRPRGGG